MAVSQVKATIPCAVQTVWAIVTDLRHCDWRSDLSRIVILSDTKFIEYTKSGFPTVFTVTVTEPWKRWEFDLENDNIQGHWSGLFTERGGQTELTFTEDVTAKKLLMKPFVKAYLKRQQAQYLADLQKAVQAVI